MGLGNGQRDEPANSASRGGPSDIRLRNVVPDDLPTLYEYQLDPEANRMAVTNPRSTEAFAVHWESALSDPHVMAKVILLGDELAGIISCFNSDGLDVVGYWLGQTYWGRGIATRALELLLTEVSIRPLHARVAITNGASLRVLQKCGFAIIGQRLCPADDRYPECEEAILELK